MDRFMDALEQGNLETLRKCPKADLHNHFALGGSRRFLYQATGKKIEPLVHPLTSMARWINGVKNISVSILTALREENF